MSHIAMPEETDRGEIQTAPITICKAFDNLTPDEIANLDKACVTQNFGRGRIILKQDEIPKYYYIIIDGYVLGSYTDKHENVDHSFEVLTKGFLFEKDITFGTKKCTLSYKALSTVQVVRIEKQHIHNLARHMDFQRYIINELNNEIMNLRWRTINNTFTIETKISQLILMLSEKFGLPNEDEDGAMIQFRITNSDMAHMLDSTRESVNRTLNKLVDKGLIHMGTGNIFVNNRLKDSIEPF
jgi:CRP/FNR family cyclic AMP-dependent transcriptional regulator